MKNIQKYGVLILLILMVFGSSVYAADPTINYKEVEEVSICEQDLPYRWRNKLYDEQGMYRDTVKSSTKWDIYTLKLETYAYTIETMTVGLCDECSFEYQSKTYTKPGIYSDTIRRSGCDSIFQLIIQSSEGYHFYDTAHICEGSTYKWHKKNLSEYGDYLDSYKTKTRDLDSVYHLHLIVHNTVETIEEVTVCKSELPYYWMNNPRTKTGEYTVRLKTKYGCDSIAILHLTVIESPKPDTVIKYFCPNEGFITHGVKVTKDTTFRDTTTAVNGCDSVMLTHFIPYPTYLIEEIVQHYEGDTVEWRGKKLVNDTICQDSLTNRFGCDSIYQLRLITKYDIYREISRCGSDTAMHGDSVIRVNTIFHDTLFTTKGADSIIHTSYNFIQPFHSYESVTICESQLFEWTGHVDPANPYKVDTVTNDTTPNYMLLEVTANNSPKTFYDTHHLANGCDSTYEIKIFAQKAYYKDTLIIWCNDSLDTYGPFRWIDKYGNEQIWSNRNTDTVIITSLGSTKPHIIQYTEDNEAWESIACDSLERIHLIFTDRCSALERIPMCEGDSVTVDGKVYKEPGRYFNTMSSSLNLNVPDSTHNFEIYTVYATETQTEIVVKEFDLPYQWYDTLLYSEGDYEHHLKTQYSCDSLIKLHFIVIPTVYSDTTYHFCAGADTEIHLPSGKIITPQSKEGTYNDTLPYNAPYTTWGGYAEEWKGDSVVRVHIVGHESFYKREQAFIKNGGTYTWHKNGAPIVLDSPGIYWDSCTTIYGCDSIYILDLQIANSWYHKDSAYVCENDLPYVWHGKDYYREGTYFDSLSTRADMDSVYEHCLFIYPSYKIDTIVNICAETDFYHNGKLITGSIYYDTLKTQYTGCDSIYIYHINRFSKTILDEGVHYTTEGTPYIWEPVPGQSITCRIAGSYYDTIHSVLTGCDSIIYTFELRYDRPFFELTQESRCQSDVPFEWRGRNFYNDTVVADTFRTKFLQLDSIYRLELTVRPTYYTSETQYICKGEGVNFKGEWITTPGIYKDSVQSSNLCDSVHILNLVQAPNYFIPETISYVTNEELPILWHGKSLPGEGTYYDSLTTQIGHPCDSVHQVTVIHTPTYRFESSAAICEGEYYEWQGEKFYETGDYTKPYKSIHNLDSVYVLHLTVNEVKETHISAFICKGESYPFLDTVLTEPTIYRDTLINPTTLCDSIFEVVINWYDNSETIVNHIFCQGTTENIAGEVVSSSGVYYETLSSITTGCDSVIKHIVTVGKPYYHEESHVIRKGDSYTWHHSGTPVVVTEEGEYWDSCHTMLGCDSIMKLTLIFAQDIVIPTVYDTICQTDLPYIWYTHPIQKALSEEGLYHDTCKGNGSDTIRSLQLTIIPTAHSSETLEFCFGESHRINGVLYTEDAVVTETLPGKHGCDSIVTYHLKFYPRYEETYTKTLDAATPFLQIEGADNIIGGDTILRTAGIYTFHYTTSHGCDSIIKYIVNECPNPKLTVIQHNMCKGDVLMVEGTRITESRTYDFFFQGADGCDSIVRYVVKVNPSYEYTETATMCRNDVYTWRGHRNDTLITRQGTYYDSLKTTLGCDSVYVLKLTYRRTDVADTIISICQSDLPYQYKGQLYYEDRIFYDTLANNTEGCDSVLRWNYIVNKHCSEYAQYRRCEGQYKIIDGMVIDQAGTYIHHHLTEDGKDSLFRFTVHDVPNFEDTVKLSGCDSIEFDGKTYYARGQGREHFTMDLQYVSVEGCDSIIHLDLTIHMSSPAHEYSRTIADFDSVRFGPYFHNTAGSYAMTYSNIHGCDSTEILHLTVLETEYQDIAHYQICSGDNRGIEVFGKLYYPDQEYTYIADTTWISGRPIIRTADITVRKPFAITHFDPMEDQLICSDYETTFNVQYASADPLQMPDFYSVDFLTDELEAHPIHQEGEVNGKKTLDIRVNGQGQSIAPGKYRYRIKFWSAACEFNDTTLNGAITVLYPSDVMETVWNDAVMLVNSQYNHGGWVFKPPYSWTVLSDQGVDKTALIAADASQPYLYSSSLAEGDRITALLYREGYDQPIPTCEFIFKPSLPITDYPTLVYPSAIRRNMPVTVKSSQTGHFQLFSETGRLCTQGNFEEGETLVTMPSTAGCYIMTTEDNDGNRKVQKIIVY